MPVTLSVDPMTLGSFGNLASSLSCAMVPAGVNGTPVLIFRGSMPDEIALNSLNLDEPEPGTEPEPNKAK